MAVFIALGVIGVVLLVLFLVIGEVGDFLHAFEGPGGGYFSGGALAGFLGALGFIGAITLSATESTGIATGAGVAGGLLMALLVGWLTNKLRTGNDGGTVRTGSLVGQVATVLNPIPESGYGEINLVVGGHITRLNARALEPVPVGTEVVITTVLSPTSVMVEPMIALDGRDPFAALE
ncbi:NfeD family protein [Enemella sp. A6]|uniref:NfeD family protein n=1 Tax=Enemella sp. A6 TaxID=3440152 RepID=UPI003EBAF391